jgi:hypothetical protein
MLHTGHGFTQIDKWMLDRLAMLGFKGQMQVVAIVFCQKVEHQTQGGKFSKPIPFSPRDVATKGVSPSTFYRTMKFGEGKVWHCVEVGGGRSASHYEFLSGWVNMPVPRKGERRTLNTETGIESPSAPYSKRSGHPVQIEQGYPIQNEGGMESRVRSEVCKSMEPSCLSASLPCSSSPKIDPFKNERLEAAQTFHELAWAVCLKVEPHIGIEYQLDLPILEEALQRAGTLKEVLLIARDFLSNGYFPPKEPYAPLYLALGRMRELGHTKAPARAVSAKQEPEAVSDECEDDLFPTNRTPRTYSQ